MTDEAIPIKRGHEIRLRRDVEWVHRSFKAMAEHERCEVETFFERMGMFAEIDAARAALRAKEADLDARPG